MLSLYAHAHYTPVTCVSRGDPDSIAIFRDRWLPRYKRQSEIDVEIAKGHLHSVK